MPEAEGGRLGRSAGAEVIKQLIWTDDRCRRKFTWMGGQFPCVVSATVPVTGPLLDDHTVKRWDCRGRRRNRRQGCWEICSISEHFPGETVLFSFVVKRGL